MNKEAAAGARDKQKRVRWRLHGMPETGYILSTDDTEDDDA